MYKCMMFPQSADLSDHSVSGNRESNPKKRKKKKIGYY